MIKISFTQDPLPTGGSNAVVVPDSLAFPQISGIDSVAVSRMRHILEAEDFQGKKGQTMTIPAPSTLAMERLVVLGMGSPDALTVLGVEEAGGKLCAALLATPAKVAHVAVGHIVRSKLVEAELAAHLAFGMVLRAYNFIKYRTKEQEGFKFKKLEHIVIHTTKAVEAEKAFAPLQQVADAVYLTRDLQNEPSNVVYPETLALAANQALGKQKVKIKVLSSDDMKKLGMNALLGVGQGSARDSKLLIMEYMGSSKKEAPIALVGKGVTFDSGGISIKPANNMEDMKWDMGGAGVVIGTIHALAANKIPVNVVGVCGLVENMPSGTAQRPGDVVRSMSGQTIEVINTDAEGRLVLADVLWYTQETFKPRMIIDFATLTGAIVVALGEVTAGLFSNNDGLADGLMRSSGTVGEPLWRLPLREEYDRDIDCDVADMKNVGAGRGAGSITAAQFLQRFIKPEIPWAHLDIAGVTWSKKGTSLVPKGATAFGVRLAYDYITQNI
jgi:leucyl aminopeptidase